MVLLDVSVVLAAHRRDHRASDTVRPFFDALMLGDERFGVPSLVWGSFLRLATHRRIFDVPTSRADAFAFITATRAQPLHLEVAPGPRHLELLRELCDEADASGDLVPDAVLAAIALEHGAGVASLDRDFVRFPGIRVLRPGA